jgi:hypothetical protein
MNVASFYRANIPPDVVNAQRRVFAWFGIPLEQVLTTLSHADAVDRHLARSCAEAFVIFDVDCIPLRDDVVTEAFDLVTSHDRVYGARQNANHLSGTPDYVAPSFVAFSRRTYEELGRPSFKPTARGDVGAQLTYRATELGVEVQMLPVTNVEVPRWSLADGTRFGHGTTYGERVFHAFEVRKDPASRNLFVDRCETVTAGATHQ